MAPARLLILNVRITDVNVAAHSLESTHGGKR